MSIYTHKSHVNPISTNPSASFFSQAKSLRLAAGSAFQHLVRLLPSQPGAAEQPLESEVPGVRAVDTVHGFHIV